MNHNELADFYCDWLYQQEAQAADEMLFIYGYIIPQVTLGELNYEEAFGEFTPWLCQQVRECAVKDKLNEQDMQALEAVLEQMAQAHG